MVRPGKLVSAPPEGAGDRARNILVIIGMDAGEFPKLP